MNVYVSRLVAFSLIFGLCAYSFAQGDPKPDHATIKKRAMKTLKTRTTAIGVPSIDGNNLLFGEIRMNGNFTIVDDINSNFGCSATLFVKKNSDFVRVSTSVIKDGERAVGTVLDPKSKAYSAIVKGENFVGETDILGTPYDTWYEPIKNSSNETIGAYFVGFKMGK